MTKKMLLYLSIATIVLLVVSFILGTTNVVGGILYLLGFLLFLITWIVGIIRTVRTRQWLWLILFILFTPLATLIYGLIGERSPAMSMAK